LTSVNLPADMTAFGDFAFYGCSGLEGICLPERLKTIGESAFACCEKIDSIVLPYGMTYLCDKAFAMCPITEVTFPSSLNHIGEDPFEGCPLEHVYAVEGTYAYNQWTAYGYSIQQIPQIIAGDYRYEIIGDECVITKYLGSETEVSVPSSIDGMPVTRIGTRAFADCENVTSISLHGTVVTIHNDAFSDCYNLTNISIPDSVTYIESAAFKSCIALTDIIVPNSVTYLGNTAFGGCKGLTNVTLSDSMTSINTHTFYDCISLAQFRCPEGLEEIADAFVDCTNLRQIYIPAGTVKISPSAFRNCTDLVIYGTTGSAAEAFAEARGFTFVEYAE